MYACQEYSEFIFGMDVYQQKISNAWNAVTIPFAIIMPFKFLFVPKNQTSLGLKTTVTIGIVKIFLPILLVLQLLY